MFALFSPSGTGFSFRHDDAQVSAQRKPSFGSRRNPLHLSHNSGHTSNTANNGGASVTTASQVQLTPTEDGYQAALDIPGLNMGDVNIAFQGSVLTLSGGRRIIDTDPRTKGTTKMIRAFHHSVCLPNGADMSAIAATVVDGVLTVNIPAVSG